MLQEKAQRVVQFAMSRDELGDGPYQEAEQDRIQRVASDCRSAEDDQQQVVASKCCVSSVDYISLYGDNVTHESCSG